MRCSPFLFFFFFSPHQINSKAENWGWDAALLLSETFTCSCVFGLNYNNFSSLVTHLAPKCRWAKYKFCNVHPDVLSETLTARLFYFFFLIYFYFHLRSPAGCKAPTLRDVWEGGSKVTRLIKDSKPHPPQGISVASSLLEPFPPSGSGFWIFPHLWKAP